MDHIFAYKLVSCAFLLLFILMMHRGVDAALAILVLLKGADSE